MFDYRNRPSLAHSTWSGSQQFIRWRDVCNKHSEISNLRFFGGVFPTSGGHVHMLLFDYTNSTKANAPRRQHDGTRIVSE